MRYIVCYDICDDGRRTKVAKALEDYGTRVQFSVFEVLLSSDRLAQLRERVKSLLDLDQDSVRIYTLCTRCTRALDIIGAGPEVYEQKVMII